MRLDQPSMIAIEAEICTIVVSVLNVDPKLVVPNARFREDLGADSLDMVEMIVALSHEIDIRICDEEVCTINTVGEAMAYISQALSSYDVTVHKANIAVIKHNSEQEDNMILPSLQRSSNS